MDVNVEENLAALHKQLNGKTRLIAVSKTKPVKLLMQAYQAGQRDFGENKVQEMVDKYDQMPKDVRWHLIGHLQTNKVKYIAPFVHMIHSVDSEKVLRTIQKEAAKNDRAIPCLLQVHIAEEETKYGLSDEEIRNIASEKIIAAMPNVRIVGLMGMATFTEDQEQIKKEFRHLKSLFDEIKKMGLTGMEMKELSMGMSSDYQIAMQEGSTMVRVGSSIFGERVYPA